MIKLHITDVQSVPERFKISGENLGIIYRFTSKAWINRFIFFEWIDNLN